MFTGGLMLKLKLHTLATWCEELTYLTRPWCWERLKAGGEGAGRGWESWMASLTRWTWVWASSRNWWWTGKPGMLQSMGSQRIRHDWATEQEQQLLKFIAKSSLSILGQEELPLAGASSSVDKESACNAGDLGSIPWSGRSPGEGNGNPLHYSCLENPMNRGAWWATVHGVARVGDLVTKPPPLLIWR